MKPDPKIEFGPPMMAGSTGDSPVPRGDPPRGTGGTSAWMRARFFLSRLATIPSGQWPVLPVSTSDCDCRLPAKRRRAAFTLIEVMVVVVMLAVIILGLMAMFTQVQRAFRAGMTQTDVLEGGRVATEMIARELEQAQPSHLDSILGRTNFVTLVWNQFVQTLPASNAQRTNVMCNVFFLTHENQKWTGIGYFLYPDTTAPPGPVATLYRFETNNTATQFAQNPGGMLYAFNRASAGFNLTNSANLSKVLDGIVHFQIHASDLRGYWINPAFAINPDFTTNRIWTSSDWSFFPNQVNYHFVTNGVPAFVDFELGILEQNAYDRYKSLPVFNAQTNYLAHQAARVHVFRQRVGVRNVDPAAY